jgi:hypothetical protein
MAAVAAVAPPWASLGSDTTPLLDKQLILELPQNGCSKTEST